MDREAMNEPAGRKKPARYRNPYFKPFVSRLITLPFFMAAYVVWFRHSAYASIVFIMIGMLTLSMVPDLRRSFLYRKFKKRHPEPEFDRNYFENEYMVDSFPYRRR